MDSPPSAHSSLSLSAALERPLVTLLSFLWVSLLNLLVASSGKMRAHAHWVEYTRRNSPRDSFPVYVLDPNATDAARAVLGPSDQMVAPGDGLAKPQPILETAVASMPEPGSISSETPLVDEQVRDPSFSGQDNRWKEES